MKNSPKTTLASLLRRHRRPPPGSPPGTITVTEGTPPPRVSFVRYTETELTEREKVSIEDLALARDEEGILWVNVNGLGDAQILQGIGRVFGLHPLATADVAHVDQRPKVEIFDSHLFVIARMFGEAEPLQHEQISLFFGKDFVITFQEREGDSFAPVRERLRKPTGKIRKWGSDYLAYALLDSVVDAYFHPLEKLGDRLDALEDDVLGNPNAAVVRRLHVLKRELLVMRRAAWPLREIFSTLLRGESAELISQDLTPYLRDGYDHTVQIMDMVEVYREVAVGQMELYLSTVSQRTNEIMKILTMFASVFIPLTFIAGIYGMNFDPAASPWNMPEIHWAFGYPAVLVFMAMVTAFILWFFHRRGWLTNRM